MLLLLLVLHMSVALVNMLSSCTHVVTVPGLRDSREGFFKAFDVLQPDIETFGQRILDVLGLYVQPDYSRLIEKPPPFHLHECFWRVLLRLICGMKFAERYRNVQFTTGATRKYSPRNAEILGV
jgi:hypothetical protein